MATLQSIAGKNGCGESGTIATGKKGCQITFGTPKHAIRLKKGTVIPSTTVFNMAYLISLIKSGVAVPVMEATGFERLSGEDGFSTTSDTTERLNVLGLPKYRMTFQEGHEFYRQISKLTGFKNSDWLIIDDYGNMKIAINSKGDFVGFTAGQVVAEQVMEKVQGGDGESKSITMQFINRRQWDSDYTIVTQEQSEINWEEIQGSNPVNISFVSVPADTDTTIVVSALLSADNSTHVEAITQAYFQVLVNSAEVVVANVVEDSVAKTYTITIPALSSNDVVEVRLYDSGINIVIEDVVFTSNTASETVQ